MILVDHLGQAELGTAWRDADGGLWIVWPDGRVKRMGGRATCHANLIGHTAAVQAKLRGPFEQVARGLTAAAADALAARANVRGKRLWPSGVESIDEPGSGLRWAAGQ